MSIMGRPQNKKSKAALLTSECYFKLETAAALMDKYALSATGQEVRSLIGEGMQIAKCVNAILHDQDKEPTIQSRIVHFLEGAAVVLLLMACTAPAFANQDWQGVVVHITDSTHMSPEECDSWHRENGWDSCGYNFVIEPDGVVYEGRGLNKVGAHVSGQNSKFLGVAFVSTDEITVEQIEAFYAIKAQYFPTLNVYPHNEFNKGKRCPGQALQQLNAYKVEAL